MRRWKQKSLPLASLGCGDWPSHTFLQPFPANGRDILRRRRAAGRKRLLPKGVEVHFKRHIQQHA
jgi:hypothetical protein